MDWKTEVEKSFRFGHRLKRVTIPSHWQSAKDMYDYTVPDCLAYLNPRFRPRILETITHQMNMIVTKLTLENPRFKGKVSLVTHSLGTVITYDLLTRQRHENFDWRLDCALEAVENIRRNHPDGLLGAFEDHVEHQGNLAERFLRPSVGGGSELFGAGTPEASQEIDNNYLQLIFPVKNYFLFGSPLGLFGATYFEEPFIRSKLPTVGDFFNVFHPSDLVANRLEPLIKKVDYSH